MADPVENELSPIKRALLELREVRDRLRETESAHRAPVAVIGMGCRLPGDANDPEAFWSLLRDGVDAISPVSTERWGDDLYDPDPDAPGRIASRHGGLLRDERLTDFDAAFFSISPREAQSLDPQQRLLLEVAWEALEHAGQAPDRLRESRTGVFVGISATDYMQRVSGDRAEIDAYLATGNSHSVASGRLSYLLGLQGPSLSVDTACSSSLVAVHLACQSLRLGESRTAIAGGVNVLLWPAAAMSLSKAHMMAPDGRCKTFDARADGFVRAEGCGLVVLKRLSDALADGDPVLAVIRGTAVNQDGRSSGLTAPNGPAQEAVIREALDMAGVPAPDVGYVETHGTGTSLGDPIEVQALGAALCDDRPPHRPLLIGSAKTNLGHLESAAGVAALIKTVLILQRGEIPPHLHLENPSPHIPWERLAIRVPTEITPWPRDAPRIAGVSSFGFSGTNAHVVLEEAPPRTDPTPGQERPLHLLTLSARSDTALGDLAGRYARHLEETGAPVADLAFTANVGRAQLPHRAALVASTTGEAAARLRALVEGGLPVPGTARGRWSGRERPKPGFLFTGGGSQYAGMGRELYETQPTFRRELERCGEVLGDRLERPLLEVLYGSGSSHLDEMRYMQPGLFALEWSLGELWRSWGVEPTWVMGHSVGEYVAACVAGVFTLEEGLGLIAARGRLMGELPGDGAMVSFLASEERVREALAGVGDEVSVAAVNGPESVVISGRRDAVERVAEDLSALGVKTKRLQVSHASHSTLVDPMLEAFAEEANRVEYRAPRLGLVSNLTGDLVKGGEIDAGYWVRHAREAVRFRAGMETLREQGCGVFVEVGPSPVLLGMGQTCAPAGWGVWLPTLRPGRGDWEQALESVGELWVRGVEVGWSGFDRDYPRRKVALPTYPFQRQRFWVGSDARPAENSGRDGELVWKAVEEAGRRQSSVAPLDLSLSAYPAMWESLDGLATALILRTLRSLEAFSRDRETVTVDTLLSSYRIQSTYRPLMRRWLEALVAEGLLVNRGEEYESPRPLPEPDLETVRSEAARQLAELPFLLEYLDRCGEKLPAVLQGTESPLETIFPGGSFETADHLYSRWPMARYFNEIIGAVVETATRAMDPGRPLRIVEIGAGTGGTTAAVLPRVPAERTSYVVTDTSDVFLSRAARRFAEFPFVSHAILDIERSPEAQGFARRGFDLAIAANVFHATRDLRETVGHAATLLAPGGLLLILETVCHPRWFDVSFGLIEGWQRFADERRRENPLLGPKEWEEVLHESGLERSVAFPPPGSPAEALIDRVFVARAPGRAGTAPPEAQVPSPTPAPTEEPTPPASHEVTLVRVLAQAPAAERLERIAEYVEKEVTQVLRLPGGRSPDRRHRLMDLGFDSLMAVEFRNRLQVGLGLDALPATLVFDYPTVDAIATYVVGQLLASGNEAEDATAPPAEVGTAEAVKRVEELSEEEAEARLLERLGDLEGR